MSGNTQERTHSAKLGLFYTKVDPSSQPNELLINFSYEGKPFTGSALYFQEAIDVYKGITEGSGATLPNGSVVFTNVKPRTAHNPILLTVNGCNDLGLYGDVDRSTFRIPASELWGLLAALEWGIGVMVAKNGALSHGG